MLLADPGVNVTGSVAVSGTQANQPVTLRGLNWTTAYLASGYTLLSLTNCAGAVMLQRITQPSNATCLA